MSSVSVIIPFFNSAGTLSRALTSIQAQSLAVDEVVIVDDGSNDCEAKLLRKICSDFPDLRLNIIDMPENGGPASARNLGWKNASSDWVAFLDSDDAWHPLKNEIQWLAVGDGVDMVSSLTRVGGSDDPRYVSDPSNVRLKRVRLFDFLIRNMNTTSSVMIRRSVEARFPESRYFSEDYELWLRVAASGKVVRVEHPLVIQFASPISGTGLSSRILQMIVGEYETFSRLRNAKVLSNGQFCFAVILMAGRVVRRLTRLGMGRATSSASLYFRRPRGNNG